MDKLDNARRYPAAQLSFHFTVKASIALRGVRTCNISYSLVCARLHLHCISPTARATTSCTARAATPHSPACAHWSVALCGASAYARSTPRHARARRMRTYSHLRGACVSRCVSACCLRQARVRACACAIYCRCPCAILHICTHTIRPHHLVYANIAHSSTEQCKRHTHTVYYEM